MPEEEFGLFNFSFGNALFEAYWRVPAFTHWWEEADSRPLYREFRALMRTIAWSRAEPAGRPWILKVPRFMEDLPVLLETFPDARLICLDRDLDSVAASSASLVWNNMRIHSDSASKRWVGREWLRKTLLRSRLAEEARKARPDVPQIGIGFEAMNRDWRGEIGRVYDFLGLPLTPAVLTRMTRYVASERRHLGHRYSLAEFGLSLRRPDPSSIARNSLTLAGYALVARQAGRRTACPSNIGATQLDPGGADADGRRITRSRWRGAGRGDADAEPER